MKFGKFSFFASGAVALVLALQFAALPVKAHAPDVSLTGLGTATIDGVMSTNEWDDAGSLNFDVNVPEGGGSRLGTVFVMNDTNNLYLAIRFERMFVDPGNTASFEFDNDHGGGVRVNGDDVILINPTPTVGFKDLVRTTQPPCPENAICALFDTSFGGTNDGAGAFSNDGIYTVYEFSHPLDSSDDANDFSLSLGDTIGFTLHLRLLSLESIADTRFPTVCVSCPNLFGDIVIAGSPEPRVLVADLTEVVIELNLKTGITKSLDRKLDAALKAIDDLNEKNDTAACNSLQAFINSVEAQSGTQISKEDANALVADVQDILALLECG